MKPLRVAILWHMHQPDYRDPVSGQTLLPWTWLHAVKDYGEMLKTAAEFDGARMTFNMVPTLVEQLDRYVDGSANDHWLELARRDPANLDLQERRTLLLQFFSVHHERHLFPLPRYRELLRKRSTEPDPHQFSEQELRDLQLLFLLAWSGHHLGRSELIQRLRRQGRDFSEADKAALFELYDGEVAGVLDLYRTLEQQGKIEISVTPYAHPILPLLCDSDIAAEAAPGTPLPRQRFRHPRDAELQVRYGLQLVRDRLGDRPRGMWPAEGSVSEAALEIFRRQGASWVASDEGILHRSLPGGVSDRSLLYRPYSYKGLPILFRDLPLSDRIGFVYAHWQPQRAAEDLLSHLKRAASHAPDGLLPLILDGENCWERYQDNGYPFLRALYQGILQSPELRMVTVSEALSEMTPTPLKQLAPGSWINSDFGIWIGHQEENRAWELLETARRATAQEDVVQQLTDNPQEPLPEALLHLLRAEGSDWFWWFGDDHSTDQADLFDRLFRRHLEALYLASGTPVPAELSVPIKPPRHKPQVDEPRSFISPVVNGRTSDYFEWLGAGRADLLGGGAMHAGSGRFAILRYGYDEQQLYLRIDPLEQLALADNQRLELQLHGPPELRLSLWPPQLQAVLTRDGKPLASCPVAASQVVEAALPLAQLGLQPGDTLRLSLLLLEDESPLARWPADGALNLPYRGKQLEVDEWSL